MKEMTVDGNRAVSYISYAFCEVAAIYPITPASPMAELVDEWASAQKYNLFGKVPKVVQMQSESGAAGVLHGALTCGALATTYTCSQGLLLMLPTMYKIAGELLPTVLHVSARSIATHALSIFGDHQDVMACRQTGFAMLASSSVQECADMALVAHLATLQSSVPFLHFFDGFRTSHEVEKIQVPNYEEIEKLLDESALQRFKARALTPKRPTQRGTAQNGDIYFQNRERANPYYLAVENIVQNVMDKVVKITKRAYHVCDYFGAPDAERVIVMMGSGASTAQETVEKMCAEGKKVGLIKIRLYRPFPARYFCGILPKTCKMLTALDRTKEAGSLGEPLYLDVLCALQENGRTQIQLLGGRYGLGSKDFSPSHCYAVFENMRQENPKNHFTVGICDDITGNSLPITTAYHSAPSDCVACKFYGLGSDGTVGANKNSIKIIGEHTPLFVQGYFQYDSKKSGGATISHLRFGKSPIHSAYYIQKADFVACHDPSYLFRYDTLTDCKQNGVFLLNCPHTDKNTLNAYLPPSFKKIITQKQIKLYVIDGTEIARKHNLSGRTGTIMQAAFFYLNQDILPYPTALEYLKEELRKTFSKKGEAVVQNNIQAIEEVQGALHWICYDENSFHDEQSTQKDSENSYYERFMRPILALQGDSLPVSAFTADGTVPTGTAKYENHGVAARLPKWIMENCIQCNQCAFVCPHAVIRPVLFAKDTPTPSVFSSKPANGIKDMQFRIQIAADHCTGCGVCADTCPTKQKALVMVNAQEIYQNERENYRFATTLPTVKQENFKKTTVKGSQFCQPLFEFSYACAGCGETPYIKLLTQLFGEKMLIANATGCSSIYGGSAPSCPYTVNEKGEGPAWANSLFENNAEFGYGMRLACDTDKQSVWMIGGDGWAYDIGFGGLDHVLSSGENINILVLDSEVYSNTGGQTSKATPLGAVARFSATGRRRKKKNLALMAMTYGDVYVAQVCMGADKQQLVNALIEAEEYNGVSLIIAYSPCIAHGFPMQNCIQQEQLAVRCGYWHLFRYHPQRKEEGQNPFMLDSKAPEENLRTFLLTENRFRRLQQVAKDDFDSIIDQATKEAKALLALYQSMAK